MIHLWSIKRSPCFSLCRSHPSSLREVSVSGQRRHRTAQVGWWITVCVIEDKTLFVTIWNNKFINSIITLRVSSPGSLSTLGLCVLGLKISEQFGSWPWTRSETESSAPSSLQGTAACKCLKNVKLDKCNADFYMWDMKPSGQTNRTGDLSVWTLEHFVIYPVCHFEQEALPFPLSLSPDRKLWTLPPLFGFWLISDLQTQTEPETEPSRSRPTAAWGNSNVSSVGSATTFDL